MINITKKYRTRAGHAVRILCTDAGGKEPVVAIITDDKNTTLRFGNDEEISRFSIQGVHKSTPAFNLVEVTEYDSWKIDDLIKVRNTNIEQWEYRYFAGTTVNGCASAWNNGTTSLTANARTTWEHAELVTPEELEMLKKRNVSKFVL